MEECTIGNKEVKIYGIAKGSGMIFPNMATTLGYIFTDADLSNNILSKLLKKNIDTTFNAITCDGDTSTNDMVSIFSTRAIKIGQNLSLNDKVDKNKKIKDFNEKIDILMEMRICKKNVRTIIKSNLGWTMFLFVFS